MKCTRNNSKLPKRHQLSEEVKLDIKLRRTAYTELINSSLPARGRDAEGFFGPGSMHWRLYGKPGIILGAYRALLLQVAHPAVADGVRQFSDFKSDYLGRAERTFTNMIKIYFGDWQTALESGKKLHHIHSMIRGTVVGNNGGRTINLQYCANDPDLLLWVLATLIDTTLVLYEAVCEPLTGSEKSRFYEESKLVATVMGIPKETIPNDLDAFYSYYNGMLDGEELRVDAVTLRLSKAIFQPPYFPAYLAKVLATGFLPPRFRREYGLEYTAKKRKHFRWAVAVSSWVSKLLPHPLGYALPYYQAHYRIAKARGLRPKFSDTFFNWLAETWLFRAVSL